MKYSIILAAFLALGLTACGEKPAPKVEAPAAAPAPAAEAPKADEKKK